MSTLRGIGLALLITTSPAFASDGTELPSYDEVPLCDDPVSTYSCLGSDPDPTIDEQWEHTESDRQADDPSDEEGGGGQDVDPDGYRSDQ